MAFLKTIESAIEVKCLRLPLGNIQNKITDQLIPHLDMVLMVMGNKMSLVGLTWINNNVIELSTSIFAQEYPISYRSHAYEPQVD